MGNYNSQYESYYSNLINKRRNSRNSSYSSDKDSTSFKLDKSFLLRRVIQDLVGVFLLFTFVMVCKLVVTSQTQAAYNFSKEIVNKNYDYKNAVSLVKNFNYKSAETGITSWLEGIKVKITGTESIKNKIKSNFIMPVKGTVTSLYGERTDPVNGGKEKHQGIDIDAKEGTSIICPYDGKVKESGVDEELGKYILVDHGSGIETKYGHLSEVSVKNGDTLKKEQVIGKVGSTGKSTAPHLHFELLYMGENKNPEEYMDLSKTD